MSIRRCEGVYDPDDDSYLLLNIDEVHGKVIDLGSGTGIVGVHYLENGCNVLSIDISKRAAECTLSNMRMNGLRGNVIVSDLLIAVKGHFDYCLFNPPYLPSDEPTDLAWTGGVGGMEITERFLDSFHNYCKIAFLIESSFAEIDMEKFNDLTFNIIRKISYEFEELRLVRVQENGQH